MAKKTFKHILEKKHAAAMNVEIISEIQYIDTKIPTFNYVLSGKPLTGGIPLSGKTIVMYGGEGCGKTSFVLHLISQAIKTGVDIVYLDTERSITKPRLIQFNVDLNEITYLNPSCMEECFEIIEDICREKEDKADDNPLLIIWDSIASTPTQAENERTAYDLEIGQQASVLTRNLRRIRNRVARVNVGLFLIQQARDNQDRFGDIISMPGGHALKHNCETIVRVSAIKPDENGQGIKISTPKKNRLFKPFQSTTVRFLYVEGFTDENVIDSFCDFLKQVGILGSSGAWCYLQTDVDKLMKAENLPEKEAVKKIDKFYKSAFVERLLKDKDYYNQILAESEEYVNKHISQVAKAMLDDEIDIEKELKEAEADDESCEYDYKTKKLITDKDN